MDRVGQSPPLTGPISPYVLADSGIGPRVVSRPEVSQAEPDEQAMAFPPATVAGT